MPHGIRAAAIPALFTGIVQGRALGGQASIPFEHVVIDAENPNSPHCKTIGDIDRDGYFAGFTRLLSLSVGHLIWSYGWRNLFENTLVFSNPCLRICYAL